MNRRLPFSKFDDSGLQILTNQNTLTCKYLEEKTVNTILCIIILTPNINVVQLKRIFTNIRESPLNQYQVQSHKSTSTGVEKQIFFSII